MDVLMLGKGKYIRTDDVSAIFDLTSIGEKSTYIQHMREEGMLIDMSGDKQARSAIVSRYKYVIFSDIKADTLKARLLNLGDDA